MSKIAGMITLILLFSSNAYSTNYFDILLNEFEQAKDEIKTVDIEPFGWPHGRICIEATESDKENNRTAFVSIARYTRLDPGYGDILPSIETVRILYRSISNSNDVFEKNGDFDSYQTLISDGEIVTSLRNNRQQAIDSLVLRKRGDWLFFRRTFGEVSNSQRSFGYCYHSADTRRLNIIKIK